MISECHTLEKQADWSLFSSNCETHTPPSPKPEDLGNYHPFLLEGYVSLSEGGDSVTVKVFHDTGATQSL